MAETAFSVPSSPDRAADLHLALRLEGLTIAWMTVEAGVAMATGHAAHSLALEAFGVDSLIELISAGVLLWRLLVELQSDRAVSEAIERRAGRIGGLLLFGLAVWVLASGIHSLWTRQGQDFSPAGLVLVGVAIPIMAVLAKGKLRLADRLGSRALRADAVEALTCGYLSFVVLIALVAQLALHAWWVAGSSALLLVPFLLREAWEAWRDEPCCDAHADACRGGRTWPACAHGLWRRPR